MFEVMLDLEKPLKKKIQTQTEANTLQNAVGICVQTH